MGLPKRLAGPSLLIGEGAADAKFFEALISDRGIPGYQTGSLDGKDSFQSNLEALKASADLAKLKLVVLVRDSDDDQAAAFASICRQVSDAGYGVPQAPQVRGPSKSSLPPVIVLLLPQASPGCLETLIYQVLKVKYADVAAEVEQLASRVPTGRCEISKRSKALVAYMIASVCVDDPGCAVSYMWGHKKGFRDLLLHPVFDDIAKFLTEA